MCVVEARLRYAGHRRQPGGDGDGVAVVRAAVLAVAGRHQPVHDVVPAAEDAQRDAAADRLAQRTQVGRDAQVFLRPAGAHAEGAEHFVEDQQHAAFSRQFADAACRNSGEGMMQPAL